MTIAFFAIAAPLAVPAQTPMNFSVAGGLSLPIGDLGNAANVGFTLGLRGETARGRVWRFRGDISWDRFGGKDGFFPAYPDVFPCVRPGCPSGTYSSTYSYLSLAANLLHHERGRLYEFGGLGLYNRQLSVRGFGGGLGVSETDLGLQAGLGLEFNSTDLHTFVEFGLTNVFATEANTIWFPVKFGIRF